MGTEVSRCGASYCSCPFAALRVLIRLLSFTFPLEKKKIFASCVVMTALILIWELQGMRKTLFSCLFFQRLLLALKCF